MEFNEKLQELRRQKGLTQEELAQRLYVSRTAISKWESGRGYPSLESLKAIASFFSVTVDTLLSTNEVLTLAEENTRERTRRIYDLVYGFLDLGMAMFLFLPFFAMEAGGEHYSVSLLSLEGVALYLKILYFTVIIATCVVGALTLALQCYQGIIWEKSKRALSLCVGASAVLLFAFSRQPYASVFAFVLISVKAILLMKRR